MILIQSQREVKMKSKKLFRVTLTDGKKDRLVRIWAIAENELISDLKKRLPYLTIENVTEVKKVIF